MSDWEKFNHNIKHHLDDLNSMVEALNIKVSYSDANKLWLMWEIVHNLINKFLMTIVHSDVKDKIAAKKHFLESVMHSCQGAIDHRLQEGIDEN